MTKNQSGFKTAYHSFSDALLSSVRYFRTGEDSMGLNRFLFSMKELGNLQELYQNSGKPPGIIEKIMPTLQKLLEYMRNQDIAGMTDLLEFELAPLAKEWAAECDGINAGESEAK